MPRKPAHLAVHPESIVQAAAEVLKRKGYEATTMKDIAAEVDLTAASLYHHFANKNALMLAVLEQGLDVALAQLGPVATSDLPVADKLRAMIAVHVTGVAGFPEVGAAMVYEIGAVLGVRPPTGDADEVPSKVERDFVVRRDAFLARRDQFEAHFRAVVQQGVAAGVFRMVDVPIFVKTMLGAQNWVGVWFRPDGRLSGSAVAEHIADTFVRALTPDAPPPISTTDPSL